MQNLLEFLELCCHNVPLLLITLLMSCVVLVNGWTDAPNAIASIVATGTLSMKKAVLLAAACNLLGVVVMTKIHASVALTVYSLVDFRSESHASLLALCAALLAVVLWAVGAWFFGIPTSESHALLAGVTGAALALGGGWERIRADSWGKVLLGLAFSVLLGFLAAYAAFRLLKRWMWRNRGKRKRVHSVLCKGQILGGGAMAFLHGAQDGQKFIGIFLLGVMLAKGESVSSATELPVAFWMMIGCALLMAAGTAIGGKRIIQKVGMDLVALDTAQGFAADVSAALCLLVSLLTGVPVSTTHTKTASLVGAGAASGGMKSVNPSIMKEIAAAWLLTFPGCGILGFLLAKLFIFCCPVL